MDKLERVAIKAKLYALANSKVEQQRKELAEVCREAYSDHNDRIMSEVCQRNGLQITRARVQQLRKAT